MKNDTYLPVRVIPRDWVEPLDLASVFGMDAGGLEVDVGSGKGRFLLARARARPSVSNTA